MIDAPDAARVEMEDHDEHFGLERIVMVEQVVEMLDIVVEVGVVVHHCYKVTEMDHLVYVRSSYQLHLHKIYELKHGNR